MQRSLLLSASLALLLSACNYLPDWAGGEEAPRPRLEGERIAVLGLENTIKPDPSLEGAALSLPAATPRASWPQAGGGSSGMSGHIAYGGGFSTASDARAGEGNKWEQVLIPAPVASTDAVFAMDADNIISAHSLANLDKVIWVSQEMESKNDDPVPGGGLALDNGKLYVTTGSGNVAVLDPATGKALWKKNVGEPLRSAPRVEGERLFVITVDNQLLALSADKGDVIWNDRGINESAGYLSAVTPVVSANLVVGPYSSGEIHALSADNGKQIWQDSLSITRRNTATAVFAGIGADLVVADGRVYASSNSGLLVADDAVTGNRIWDQELTAQSTPWVAGDLMFTLTAQNQLVALTTRDGRVKWVRELPRYENETKKKDPITWSGPLLIQNPLIVAGAHGQMLLVSPMDGTVKANYIIPDGVYTTPIVAGDRIILITKSAKLVALH